MNYIFQVKGFWIIQEVNQLGKGEIAMYFYLLEVWNKTGWIATFKRNNYKIMADLVDMRSYKTLQGVRTRLQLAGVLKFNQRNGDANAEYEMIDLSNFYKGSGIVNINQTKPNQTNNSKSHLGEKENKKSELIFWKEFIKTWNEFYINKNGSKYFFLDKDFKHLKKIYQILEKESSHKNIEFTNESLMNAFKFFLNKAWDKDDWLKKNFTVSNVLSQFNQIVNGNTTEGFASKPVNKYQQGFDLVKRNLAQSCAMEEA